MNGLSKPFLSIEQAEQLYYNTSNRNIKSYDNDHVTFQQLLNNEANKKNEVVFSKHANNRLISRSINLSKQQVERLNNGVNQAREKSIKESLVMIDNLAFIVNISNNTVVTALEQMSGDGNVFTNIDGAVIV